MSGQTMVSATQLRRGWVVAARVVWLILIAAQVFSFIATFPAYLAGLVHTCAQNCVFTPQQVQVLQSAGITLHAYIWVTAVLFAVIVLVAITCALILFWRRSDDWMVLAIGYFVVSYPVGIFASASATPVNQFAAPSLLQVLTLPGILIPYAVFLLFPSGRFVPRWSWVLLIAWVLWYLPVHLQPGLLNGPLVLGYPVFYGAILVCQVYRYRRASTPLERQQTKWVAVSFVATLVTNQLFWQSTYVPMLLTFVAFVVYQLSLLFLPVAFFMAVQRHRLYDIDALINRALVYGSLTAILVAAYVAGVIGAQRLLSVVIPDARSGQPAFIVVTTLLVAALFQPLRTRVQALVDRRFYRTKYDATRTIAAFSATLQQEVDLATLRDHVLEVVTETMQPTHASLVLLEPSTRRADRAASGSGAPLLDVGNSTPRAMLIPSTSYGPVPASETPETSKGSSGT
jgi:hypothetical protein